jgi:hypothetical protein
MHALVLFDGSALRTGTNCSTMGQSSSRPDLKMTKLFSIVIDIFDSHVDPPDHPVDS